MDPDFTYRLKLIIDNDQRYLREWLRLARRFRGKLTADDAERYFRNAVGLPTIRRTYSLRQAVFAECSDVVDWQEIAEHYNTKDSEGASVPEPPMATQDPNRTYTLRCKVKEPGLPGMVRNPNQDPQP